MTGPILTPRLWDETTAGLASTIRTIELTEKLAIIETILQLNLHDSWDRTHKTLLLEACSQAYRTERTFVEVIANTHRGIQNGTETQENLESWTKSLVKAEKTSKKAEAEIEPLRANLWDVIFDEKRAIATLGERGWSEPQKQIIQRRRDEFQRACRRIENLREEIKAVITEEKILAVYRGESLLVAFNAPRSSFFPEESKYDPGTQSSSDAIREKLKEDRLRAAINGTSPLNLAHLTPEQKRKYENLQERRLMVQRRVEERMERYSKFYPSNELQIPFELSDSEDENVFAYSSSKRRRVNNVSIYEKLKKHFEGACKPIVYTGYTAERARTFEGYDVSPTGVNSLSGRLGVGERLEVKACVKGRKEQREMTREKEEERMANEDGLKHK